MLINIIGTVVILAAVAGAVAYLARRHSMAKKSGGHACVGCGCGCSCVSDSCSTHES